MSVVCWENLKVNEIVKINETHRRVITSPLVRAHFDVVSLVVAERAVFLAELVTRRADCREKSVGFSALKISPQINENSRHIFHLQLTRKQIEFGQRVSL